MCLRVKIPPSRIPKTNLVFLEHEGDPVVRIGGGASDPASTAGGGTAAPVAGQEVGVVRRGAGGGHRGAGQAAGVPLPSLTPSGS